MMMQRDVDSVSQSQKSGSVQHSWAKEQSVEWVGGMPLPKPVAARLPKFWARAHSDCYVVQCFVDLFLDPPRPIPLAKSRSTTFHNQRSLSFSRGSVHVAEPIAMSGSSSDPYESHQPRGPYLVRLPNDVMLEDATNMCIAQMRRIQAEEKAAGPPQHLRPQSKGGEGDAERGEGVEKRKRKKSEKPELPTDDESRTLRSLPIDIPEDGLILRPCDCVGRALSSAAFLERTLTLREQFPKYQTTFFLVLSKDPEVARAALRQKSIAQLEEERAKAAAILQRRNEQVEEVENSRRRDEIGAYINSQTRDIELREKMRHPEASREVKQWQREALIHQKKLEAEASAAQREEEERKQQQQYLESLRALTVQLFWLEAQSEEAVTALRGEESQRWEELACREKNEARCIASAARASCRMHQIKSLVEKQIFGDSPPSLM